MPFCSCRPPCPTFSPASLSASPRCIIDKAQGRSSLSAKFGSREAFFVAKLELSPHLQFALITPLTSRVFVAGVFHVAP